MQNTNEITDLFSLVKSFGYDNIEASKKTKNDVIIRTEEFRMRVYDKLKEKLRSQKKQFTENFKVSKSRTLNVLSINDGKIKGDIIIKPLYVKGAGGILFEKELENDLKMFFNDYDENENFNHKDVIEEMQKVLNFGLKHNSKFEVIHVGSKNQPRSFTFNGRDSVNIENSEGKTIADIVIKSQGKTWYVSAKSEREFRILNASVFDYFGAGANRNTRKNIHEYFGFDGEKMGYGFGEGFGSDAKPPVNYSRIEKNLANLLSQCFGTDNVVVHKLQKGDIDVFEIKNQLSVNVSSLTLDSYRYPEPGSDKRNSASISFKAQIRSFNYSISLYFSGNTGERIPRYLRINVVRQK